jgi:hypothetical protein
MKGHAVILSRLQGLKLTDVLLPQPVIAEVALGIDLLPRSRREGRFTGPAAKVRVANVRA